jgi:hypothetical protein
MILWLEVNVYVFFVMIFEEGWMDNKNFGGVGKVNV